MSNGGVDRADRPPSHRTGVLAAAVVAALLLGGWWWTSNAPPAGDGRAGEPPPTGPRPLAAAERYTAVPGQPNPPGNRGLPGEPLGPADPPRPAEAGRADPPDAAPAEIIGLDFIEFEALLPPAENVIRRQVGVLTANQTIDYSGVVPAGGSYQLDVVCVGDGALEVSDTMPEGAPSVRTIGCDGALESIELTATSTGTAVILLEARTSSLLGAATQLVGR